MSNQVPQELIPPDDAERLRDLRAYQILYTEAEDAFDNLTQIMAQVFETPMVFMSLVDENTVFYKSQVGKFGRDRTDRSLSLCSIAILTDEPTVFEDTQTEPRLANNPLVWSSGGIRFYAGAPLITVKGHRIGSVCVVDTKPRNFSAKQKRLLIRFSNVFMHEMEVRLAAIELAQSRESQKKLLQLVENSTDLMSVLDLDGTPTYINPAGRHLLKIESDQSSAFNLALPLVTEQIQAQVLETGHWSGEMTVRQHQTDEELPVHNLLVRIDDPATGKPLGMGTVMRDLRPELSTHQSLLASEQRFRAIVEQAPLALGVLKGRNMVIDLGNERIFEVWGKDKSITGLPLIEALPEIKGQPFMGLLEGVYDTGEPFFGKGTLAKLVRHGQLVDIYFDFTYTPLRDANNVVTGVMVMATEVTEQVLFRQAIEASEAKLRSVIATAPAAMGLFVGRDLVVELPNQAFIDIVGKGLILLANPSGRSCPS